MIWLVRTALLILAGMATLSIIGAIAAIPGDPAGAPQAFQTSANPVPDRDPMTPEAADAPGTVAMPAPAGAETTPVPGPMRSPPPEPALAWLEPLTYAVIALAGFAAAILVALLRIGTALAHRTDRAPPARVFTAS